MAVVELGHAALQHQRLVHKQRHRQCERRPQKPPVAAVGVGQQQQDDRRVDIALVHHRPERAHQHDEHRAGQKHLAPVFGEQLQEDGVEIRERERPPGDVGPDARFLQPQPVLPKDDVEVERVYRHVAVALRRAKELLPQPFDGRKTALGAEGQRHAPEDDERHGDAGQRSPGFARRPPLFNGSVAEAADDAHDERRQPHRGEQQRLRLDQHGKREGRQRGDVAALGHAQRAHDEEERQYRVDLPPGGGIHQHRGIEGVEGAQKQRRAAAQPLFAETVDQHRPKEVAEYGQQLQKHDVRRGIVGDAEKTAQKRHRRQQQHVSRRIVAEIALGVEVQRPHLRHALRPGFKAADVGVVAAYFRRHDQPQDQRRQQDAADGPRHAALFDRQRRAGLAREGDDHEHIAERAQQQRLRVAGRFLFDRRRAPVAAAISGRSCIKVVDRVAGLAVVHFYQRKVVEPGDARVEVVVAIAADAGEHRHLRLFRAGAPGQRQLHPVAAGVVEHFRIDVDAADGEVRAVSARTHALSAHHGAEAVDRVRLDLDHLRPARVVDAHVLHAQAAALHAAALHRELGNVRAGEPHVLFPASGEARGAHVVHGTVDQQVFALGQRRERKEKQQHKKDRQQSAHMQSS